MPSRRTKITQAQIVRTLRAAIEAGVAVHEFVVNHETGEVVVTANNGVRPNGVAEIDRLLEIK
jgi:hypothetical protein